VCHFYFHSHRVTRRGRLHDYLSYNTSAGSNRPSLNQHFLTHPTSTTMATSPPLQLPNDVIVEILTQLKRASDTTQDLASCSRVNKAWQEAATPLLYSNVAVNTANTTSFCNSLVTEKYAACIHSISVSLQPREAVEPITQLVPILPQLTNLRSFSFRLVKPFRAKIPQFYLVKLVEALPPSCTDLELDTHGEDARSKNSSTHLCASLRALLPRLRHVRLRLRSCEVLFEDISTLKLPYLKTLVYSCISGIPIATCHARSLYRPTWGSPHLVWSTVTSGLVSLVGTPGAVPPNAKVYAFMTSDYYDSNRSLWCAHVLADFQERKSTAIPWRMVWTGQIPGSSAMRLPDWREVMSNYQGLQAVAEGRLWVECHGGARLAREVVENAKNGRPSFAQGCVEKAIEYLKSSEEWRKENPRKSSSSWYNEKLTGVTLMRAVERSGEDWLSLGLLEEDTPAGWKRVDNGMNDAMERVEE
jgi:hypothetical protein